MKLEPERKTKGRRRSLIASPVFATSLKRAQEGDKLVLLRRGEAIEIVDHRFGFAAMSLDTFRAVFKAPFQWREFIQQCWFVASVSILPTTLTSIPFANCVTNALVYYGAYPFKSVWPTDLSVFYPYRKRIA